MNGIRARAVVLDRDGTLIERVEYLGSPAGVRVLPTVSEAIELLRDAGILLFLHSNQSGVGRGRFTEADALACNSEMLHQLGLPASVFERVCMAYEAPGDPIEYRKPSPKFGREVLDAYGLTSSSLCYIGDNITDLKTAAAVGCLGVGVDTGRLALREELDLDRSLPRYPVFKTLLDAARHLVGVTVGSR